MTVQIQYQMTRQESFAAIRTSKRWIFVGIPISGVALLCLVGFLWFLEKHLSAGIVLCGLYGIFILLFPELWLRWIVFRQRHLMGLPVELTFDTEGLFLKSPRIESKFRWDLFKSARAKAGFWFLRLSPYQSIAIPQRAFDSGQEADFKELLKTERLLKA